MPNQMISQMDQLADDLADDDLLVMVDTSDTTDSANGTTKKMEADQIVAKKLKTTTGPTVLAIGAVADGEVLTRSGSSIVGAASATPGAHATSHQNGGSDEISVTGLSGVLADPQIPITENVQDIVGAMFSDGDVDFTYDDSGNVETNVLQTKFKTSFVVFEFGDGKNASSLEANQLARVPYVPAGTIVRARIVGDASGSAVVDIQKSTADPPSFSSIASSAKPTLSSDVYVDDTTLTGWTTSLSAGNELRAVLESVTTCKQVTVVLEIIKS